MAKKSKKKTSTTTRSSAPSTRRSTGGPGFAFEDQVAAWFILKSLNGQPLPGVDGALLQLQMQTSTLGWQIDDILITAMMGPGDARRIAASCKSSLQVTSSGLPSAFLARAWELWSAADQGPLNRGKDRMMLATRGHHPAFEATWSDLKNWAEGSDAVLAVAQMRGTARHRRIFDNVKGAGSAPDDAETAAFIRHIEVAAFDFDMASARSEVDAIAEARKLLRNNTLAEGRKLWNELVGHARNTRLGNGTLDVRDLWRALRNQFVLKDHPDFESSWARLRAFTTDHKDGIETTLPTGVRLERQSECEALAAAISSGDAYVVFGDSGSGKSALVKNLLVTHFAQAQHVWLGPDVLQAAVSEAGRGMLGLTHPLLDILVASGRSENVLVIDAAEHIPSEHTPRVRELIGELVRQNAPGVAPAWRVLIIGQTEAWASGGLQKLAGLSTPPRHEVKLLTPGEVRGLLRSAPGLGWLAVHDDAVAALTNLRTLAWVMEAASRFPDGGAADAISLVTIADRLWGYWTDGKAATQRLLMRLAARDAAFEHSFAISQLDGSDAEAFDNRGPLCPLHIDASTNRIRFEHDLAADWARFQQLKEIANDTAQWAGYAGNPLWNGALRMLGQYLLRRPAGSRSLWDIAFETADQSAGPMRLAADILLDALFLDPDAETFLDERAELLFADSAARLLRLLRRFEHVASVPGISLEALGRFNHLSLYLEAQYRTPIFGRWPAVARFLTKHRDRVAALSSPVVAGICLRWLTGAPATTASGTPVPFRNEFAELALATARALQLELAKGAIWLNETAAAVHQAAFAAAFDLPDEVAAWALEMAQRRPLHADSGAKLEAHRRKKAEEHHRRLVSDAEYRARHKRREHIPTFMPSGRRLPPWPLGPLRSVDNRFSETVLRSPNFQALMQARPAAAAEVILAVTIEDSPEEKYGERDFDDRYGLEYDHDGYPTAFWKSPFYPFFRINAEAALDAFEQLIRFCTDRWEHQASRGRDSGPPTLSLRLADGSTSVYRGNYRVFALSQESSHFAGPLHSALAALERWLCDRIAVGLDVAAMIERLLRGTDSVAVLGVLVTVGKYRRDLFLGPLKPLLASHLLYLWDYHRSKAVPHSFDGMTWVRSGTMIFEMARDWGLAEHRSRALQLFAADIIVSHRDIGDQLLALTAQWTPPADEKEALELRILVSELDYRNYTRVCDGVTGEERTSFNYPADLTIAIAAFQNNNSRAQQALAFPDTCRRILNSTMGLNAEQGRAIADLMVAVDGGEAVNLEEDFQRPARVAAAVTLLLRAKDWLVENEDVEARAQGVVEAAMAELSDDSESSRIRNLSRQSFLEFAAYFAIETWVQASSTTADERVLRIITSGDDRAASVIACQAYWHRNVLGERWWRLQYLALMWSGLSMLAPRFDDHTAIGPRWHRWRRWLRTRDLSVTGSAEQIRPLAIAERIERFEIKRWRARYAQDGRAFDHRPGRRLSGGLDTRFLEIAFGWLLDANAPTDMPNLTERSTLAAAFWAHEAWRQTGSADEDRDDYSTMGQFGYRLVEELAHLTMRLPVDSASALWGPVFALGPKGHYAISAFLTAWFHQATESTDTESFGQRWRTMIEHVISGQGWGPAGLWFHAQQLDRHVLGFAAPDRLARLPGHVALLGSVRDLFKTWADKRLAGDEDNLAGFCSFLATPGGAPLRLDGLLWVAAALRADPEAGKWYRDRTANAFMDFLDTVVSDHGGAMQEIG